MPLSATARRRAEVGLAVLWIIAVVAATMQQGVSRQNNNYLIFRAASLHLLHGNDLYAAYPALHFDFYKYSPTFALLFLPFAVIPFAVSMLLWNAMNAAALYWAIGLVLPRDRATIARAIVFLDMLGSLQNVQSNALVAALIVFTFAAYERRQTIAGTIAADVGAIIKVFPLAGLSFGIFHDRKLRTALAAGLGGIVLLLLPLLVTSPSILLQQYGSWHRIESKDLLDRGFTVMQMIEVAFHAGLPNAPLQLAGTAALVAPLLARRDRWGAWDFRVEYLCSVLVFCVIFNHQSESPTFVIAVAGAAIWFAALGDWTRGDWALFAFFAIGTILASSDAMPRVVQREVFDRYHAKTIPCIVLWAIMQVRLWKPATNARVASPIVAGAAG